MNSPKGLPAALRVMSDSLNSAAADLAKVLNSVASALDPATANEPDETPPRGQPDDRSAPAPARGPRTARARTAAAKPAAAKPVTDKTVRAAMLTLGPATATEIAAQVNHAAGRNVVDGRAIRGHASRLGARVVTRAGRRLYSL